jgi:hypothetical protein
MFAAGLFAGKRSAGTVVFAASATSAHSGSMSIFAGTNKRGEQDSWTNKSSCVDGEVFTG